MTRRRDRLAADPTAAATRERARRCCCCSMADDEFVIGFTGLRVDRASRRCSRRTWRSARSPRTSSAMPGRSTSCWRSSWTTGGMRTRSPTTGRPTATATPGSSTIRAATGRSRSPAAGCTTRPTRSGSRRSATRRSRPLAELVAKIRREERYHLMHVMTWLERLADGGGEPAAGCSMRCGRLGPDAATVFAPLAGEAALVEAGILARPLAGIEAALAGRRSTPVFVPPRARGAAGRRRPSAARTGHSDAFHWLTASSPLVRRLEPGATW